MPGVRGKGNEGGGGKAKLPQFDLDLTLISTWLVGVRDKVRSIALRGLVISPIKDLYN